MRRIFTAITSILYVAGVAFASDLSDFQLQIDRLGTVVVGMSPKEASVKSGVKLTNSDFNYSTSDSCYYISPNGKYDGIALMVEDEIITRIDISSEKISTDSGVRIGDSENAVKNAYPGKVREQEHPYLEKEGKYLVVEIKPGYGFIFETLHGKITSFRSGKMSSVEYIEGCL